MNAILLAALLLSAAPKPSVADQWEARAKQSPERIARIIERIKAAKNEEERTALAYVYAFESTIATQTTDKGREAFRLHGPKGDTFELGFKTLDGKGFLEIGYLYDKSGELIGARIEQLPNLWLVMFLKSADTSQLISVRTPDGFTFVFLRDTPFFVTVYTPSDKIVMSEG